MNSKICTCLILACSLYCVAQRELIADVVLTFDPIPGDGLPIDQDYGDRVAALAQNGFNYGQTIPAFTPNVEVSYGGFMHHWGSSYGDLDNVLFSTNLLIETSFTADPGFDVLLYGFDLAGWPETDYVIPSVIVRDGNDSDLFMATDVLVHGDPAGPRRTQFIFSSPLRASNLKIAIDTGLTGRDNIGIDNIRFSQTTSVPEPSTMVLSGLGAFALLACKRRRS